MKSFIQHKPTRKGFSLFEMLIFISILGIMVTIAMPLFGNTVSARRAKDQRNAQSFCSLATAAQAAGVNVSSGTADVKVILHRLFEGVTVTKGPLSGRTFKLPHVTDEDIAYASEFLELRDGTLMYSRAVN